MIGALSLLQHKPEHTVEQFRHHWLNVHGPLAAELHGVRRYVQSHFAPDDPLTNDAARSLTVDGLAAISFDTEEDREICYASHQEEVCDIDSLLFIGATARYVTDVHVPVPPPATPGAARAVLLVPAAAGLSPAHLAALGRPEGLNELIVHAVTAPGATPTQSRRQILLPLQAIVEVSATSRPALEAIVARLAPSDAAGVAVFAAVEHRIV